jgi:hypothetical protein
MEECINKMISAVRDKQGQVVCRHILEPRLQLYHWPSTKQVTWVTWYGICLEVATWFNCKKFAKNIYCFQANRTGSIVHSVLREMLVIQEKRGEFDWYN